MDRAPRQQIVYRPVNMQRVMMSSSRPASEQNITESLAQFETVTLDELDAVALLDRFDTKYLISATDALTVLTQLHQDYRVLEIDGRLLHQYRTRYFDTPAFDLYRRHHADEPVRHKIRSRQYLDTGLAFFEVKTRTEQGRIVKARLRTDSPVTVLTAGARALLAANVPADQRDVEPKVCNDFERITLAGRHTPERLTLDLGLRFAYDGRAMILPGVVIAEVKRSRPDDASPFVQLMSQRGTLPTGVSKYCLGVAMLVPGIQHQAFDDTLRAIAALATCQTAT